MLSKEKNIIIADSQSTSRLGLKTICLQSLPHAYIYEVPSLNDLYNTLRTINSIDLLVLDLFMGKTSALSALPEIFRFHPGINILVISHASKDVYGNRVMKEGAKGFVNATEDRKLIEKAIKMVCEGDYFMSQDIYAQSFSKSEKNKVDSNPFESLSNKEMDIVHYLLLGMSTSEISESARLAISTVSTYKMRIYTKLHIDNVISLASLAANFEVV